MVDGQNAAGKRASTGRLLYFFREFSFSQTTFRPTPTAEVELADSLIQLGNLLLIFQLKERGVVGNTTVEAEKRWFERKVLRQATRQVRDTLRYLGTDGDIEIQNHRGHALTLDFRLVDELYKLVVYLPHESLPEEYRRVKHHRSQTAGLIHIIPATDYLGIVQTLLTPAEVVDYLSFREELIDRWEDQVMSVPESALVGQYLNGNIEVPPTTDFLEYLHRLDHQVDAWDMSRVISTFADRVTTGGDPADYYDTIRELALLKRNELREFKKRFKLSIEKARADKFALPYRMTCPRTGCGFVFIPLTRDVLAHRRIGLQNLTLAHKHEQKLSKCLGISFSSAENGGFLAEWCYMEHPWEEDPDLDEMLRSNNPFRDVESIELNRYTYTEEA
jgi:hypothetical protein